MFSPPMNVRKKIRNTDREDIHGGQEDEKALSAAIWNSIGRSIQQRRMKPQSFFFSLTRWCNKTESAVRFVEVHHYAQALHLARLPPCTECSKFECNGFGEKICLGM